MSQTCLLLIDFQKAFSHPSWGKRNNPGMEENAFQLLRAWREKSCPVVHVQHSSNDMESQLHSSCSGFDFIDEFRPLRNEKQIIKHVNSAFIDTDLDLYLKREKFKYLVVMGFTTNHCVSTTVRMAQNLGYDVTVPFDATACFETYSYDGSLFSAEIVHGLSLANLHHEFATISSTETILSSRFKFSKPVTF
ncbi:MULTISPECIES: cysteine hydrolase family protein [Rossellomorea]|jgi:nicotinamidase-related amidase|uniref:cysteine hydrolase family protein n=1 Tax=Rossellomorea TaxID=2837508 RepID=UPI0011E8FB0F|nr:MULTISPECIES: cysteine hydrolase family protein [Rossellomorea]MDT9023482.1 cysteine hydrolase family protein [Rossellomorea sp. YC4-1]TYS90726.1 cysteine hydrolase [Rossellomorea aquimaris]